MRKQIVAGFVAFTLAGCESKSSTGDKGAPTTVAKPTTGAGLVDITNATSLAGVRSVFNAHKGEARFLTLLSPT